MAPLASGLVASNSESRMVMELAELTTHSVAPQISFETSARLSPEVGLK